METGCKMEKKERKKKVLYRRGENERFLAN